MRNAPRGGGALQETAGQASTASVPHLIDDRPRCVVVGIYCESLGWLRREPACPASTCCRHYWGDVGGWSA